MTIKTKYNFGDTVYIINDPKQKPYIIVGLTVKPGGAILFDIDYGGDVKEMYEFQISAEKDVVATLKFNDQNDDD